MTSLSSNLAPVTKPDILPDTDAGSLLTLLFAGALATVAFDIFGQGISPAFGLAKLAPDGLTNGTLNALFGSAPKGAGDLMHYATGMLAYPLGWFLIARPIWKAVMPRLHWVLSAAAYGVALWIFALYGVAHFVAGMKPFLGFTGITWVALWGHIIFALVVAWGTETRRVT
jgi:hypothetical protein